MSQSNREPQTQQSVSSLLGQSGPEFEGEKNLLPPSSQKPASTARTNGLVQTVWIAGSGLVVAGSIASLPT